MLMTQSTHFNTVTSDCCSFFGFFCSVFITDCVVILKKSFLCHASSLNAVNICYCNEDKTSSVKQTLPNSLSVISSV